MTDMQQFIVMSFGAVVALAGLWLLFLRKEGATNRIKLLGQEFELSTPALIVFLVGSGIFILPFVVTQDLGKSSPIKPKEQSPPFITRPEKVKSRDSFLTEVASTDRDKPTWLTSNEIKGIGIGEHISYYYTFNAGPGIVKVTIDGKNKRGYANAIGIELSDIDAKPLLSVRTGNATHDKRVVDRVQLGRRQQIIMRVFLDEATIDYIVRLEDAVEFSPTPTPNSSN